MPQELLAALVGATMSALLMVLSNRTNKRQSDIREIFHRLNALEREQATLIATKRNPNGWRNR
tara:strand:- start:25 stop:213 length:189 start_codon:yes stop_codon:yes gene_type:complete